MKLRIEKAIYGGDGLARIPAGKTVFIPGTLPGELVEATIATDRRSFATGKLDAVLEPSAERVAPGCEYFPRCGGCQYQHAGAAFQLQMKLDILKETLGRAHVAIRARSRAWPALRGAIATVSGCRRRGPRSATGSADRIRCYQSLIVPLPLPCWNRPLQWSSALRASKTSVTRLNFSRTASKTSC